MCRKGERFADGIRRTLHGLTVVVCIRDVAVPASHDQATVMHTFVSQLNFDSAFVPLICAVYLAVVAWRMPRTGVERLPATYAAPG